MSVHDFGTLEGVEQSARSRDGNTEADALPKRR